MFVVPSVQNSTCSTQDSNCSAELGKIFKELFKVAPESLQDELKMSDLELWDSLRHMELISTIEQHFGVELSMDEISRMQSVCEIRKILAEKRPNP